MKRIKYDIFVSYSWEDLAEAKSLIVDLQKRIPELTFWLDIARGENEEENKKRITNAIDCSENVLIIVSENALQSELVRKEVTYARQKDKPMLSVLMKGAELKGWLSIESYETDCYDYNDALQLDRLAQDIAFWSGKQIVKKPFKQPAPCVSAEQLFKLGHKHYMEENFEKAAKLYKKSAEKGYAEAQYSLGLMYSLGTGMEWDDAEAVKWYQKAAEQGHTEALKCQLTALADKYETADFLPADPSQFMHRYTDSIKQEKAAFIAAALSYGSRKQFIPKIDALLKSFLPNGSLPPDNQDCFYRLHTNSMVRRFLIVTDGIYSEYGSMKNWMKLHDVDSGIEAVKLITNHFAQHEASHLIPKNTASSCKRVCMFLRWMVRNDSPVDLGLWSDIIDKSTLIMPMDTHVLQEAQRLGLIKSRSGSMATAIKLTEKLKEYFPNDPTRADFALFGLGVDKELGKR